MSDDLSVLIVEDEALLRMQLAFLLEDAGHRVAGMAASLNEAVASLKSADIDIALVDIHLADGPTGLDVGRSLRDAGIPFLFLTANAARVPADFCGAWGVINKPYSSIAMNRAIDFMAEAVRRPPPALPAPVGVQLAPDAEKAWSVL